MLDQWLSGLEEKILPLKFKLRWSEKAMVQKKSEVKVCKQSKTNGKLGRKRGFAVAEKGSAPDTIIK